MGDSEWRTEADNGVYRERDHDGAVFSGIDVDVREESWQQLEENPVAKR